MKELSVECYYYHQDCNGRFLHVSDTFQLLYGFRFLKIQLNDEFFELERSAQRFLKLVESQFGQIGLCRVYGSTGAGLLEVVKLEFKLLIGLGGELFPLLPYFEKLFHVKLVKLSGTGKKHKAVLKANAAGLQTHAQSYRKPLKQYLINIHVRKSRFRLFKVGVGI